jgi:hypothetical protein
VREASTSPTGSRSALAPGFPCASRAGIVRGRRSGRGGGALETDDADAFHFCGHTYTTGSCRIRPGSRVSIAADIRCASDGEPVDDLGGASWRLPGGQSGQRMRPQRPRALHRLHADRWEPLALRREPGFVLSLLAACASCGTAARSTGRGSTACRVDRLLLRRSQVFCVRYYQTARRADRCVVCQRSWRVSPGHGRRAEFSMVETLGSAAHETGGRRWGRARHLRSAHLPGALTFGTLGAPATQRGGGPTAPASPWRWPHSRRSAGARRADRAADPPAGARAVAAPPAASVRFRALRGAARARFHDLRTHVGCVGARRG